MNKHTKSWAEWIHGSMPKHVTVTLLNSKDRENLDNQQDKLPTKGNNLTDSQYLLHTVGASYGWLESHYKLLTTWKMYFCLKWLQREHFSHQEHSMLNASFIHFFNWVLLSTYYVPSWSGTSRSLKAQNSGFRWVINALTGEIQVLLKDKEVYANPEERGRESFRKKHIKRDLSDEWD